MNKRLDDKAFSTDLAEKLFRCIGYGANDIETQTRIDALKYYFQRERGDEEEGASQVVSGDLSAMVEATLAQMTEAFATDSIAEFIAFDKADEHQARLESAAVQYQIMVCNNGIMEFISAIKEALLFRLGVIKIWADEEKTSEIKNYANVSKEGLAGFAAFNLPKNVEVDLLEYNEEKQTAKVRQVVTRRKLYVKSIPVENFLYIEDESSDTCDIQNKNFIAERHVETRSDMIKKGFNKEVVDKLPRVTQGKTSETSARNPGQVQNLATEGLDRSQDLIEWFEIYVMADRDNDGIAEKWKISFHPEAKPTGILLDETASSYPYAVGTALINPHRIRGMSLYDKLRQIQDINTGLCRAILDNATVINQGRICYQDGKVNTDDMDSRRADRSIRVSPNVPITEALMALVIPDLSTGLLNVLNDQRQVRSEMGGAALEMASANMRLGERVGSQGLDRAYSVMEQLSALMMLTISQTLIKSTFVLAHETMRKEFSEGEVVFNKSGRWETANPSQWPKRPGVNIKLAKSPMERTRRAQALNDILSKQVDLANQGMDEVLVNLDGFYHTLIDYARAMDLPNPEKYFIDPLDPGSIEARNLKSEATARENKAQQEFAKQAVQLEQLQISLDKYKQDTELQFKYWNAVLESEIKEAEIVGDATTNIILKKMANQAAKFNGNKTNNSELESGNDEEVREGATK